jgi:histidinol-phosphate aminotransferase
LKSLKNWFRPDVLKMKGYTPGEQPRDLFTIKLNTNENPFPPSKAVLKAVRNAADSRLRLYPEPTADTLRRALSRVYHWPVEGILAGNGSDEILSILFMASVGKGDLVQYPDITYSLYPVLSQLREARMKEVNLDKDWGLDFKKLDPKARLTLWGYPNPPVGNCFPMADMMVFCKRAEGLVLIDEAYVDFAKNDCFPIARACPNVLLLRTMSKSFSLAGARLGYVFGHPEVIGELMKVKDSYNVNRLTQALGLAALSSVGLKDMKKNVTRIRFERNGLIESLRNMGFIVPDSQANFLLATRSGKPSAGTLYKNLKKRRVLIRYFSHPRLRDSIRVSVGTPAANDRLLSELKKLL